MPPRRRLVGVTAAPLQGSEGSDGSVPAGVEKSSNVEAIDDDGHLRATVHVEALLAFVPSDNPTVAPRRYDVGYFGEREHGFR